MESGEQALSGTVTSHRIGGRKWKIDDAIHAIDVGAVKKIGWIFRSDSVLNTEMNKFGRVAVVLLRTWANLTEQRGFNHSGSHCSVKDPREIRAPKQQIWQGPWTVSL
jgi:hypothetical protein